jgi:translation initiation factor IF-2
MPGKDGTVPKIEIKDRDEELRRLGRSGLVSRGPGGRDWRHAGRSAGAASRRTAEQESRGRWKEDQADPDHDARRAQARGSHGRNIAVSDLAQKMGVKGNEVIKKLWALGMMGVNINQSVDQDTATLIANEFGYQIESTAFREDEFITEGETDNPEDLGCRARRSSR